MKYTKLWLFLITTCLLNPVLSQQKKQGIISGVIKDAQTKSPLTEAVITLSSNAFAGQKFALTDSSGMYKVNNLPAGNYRLVFEMEGYEKLMHDSITLKDGMSVGISYDMVKERKKNRKSRLQVTGYK